MTDRGKFSPSFQIGKQAAARLQCFWLYNLVKDDQLSQLKLTFIKILKLEYINEIRFWIESWFPEKFIRVSGNGEIYAS